MAAEVTAGWHVFKESIADHWAGFKQRRPRYDRPSYDALVEKRLNCGNPERMGSIAYRCEHCGQGKHLVSMRCKSSFCLRGATVYVDDWVAQVSQMLHEGVIYRHIVLTVPDVLRAPFYQHASELLSALRRCGVRCVDAFFSTVAHQERKGGSIVVVQTHGRNGQYHPHLHSIATSGGWHQQAQQWVPLGYLPSRMLHKKWQWYALERGRETLKTDAMHALVDPCYTKDPNGFVAHVQKGDVPSRSQRLARSLAKYVVSPPISLRRIDRYDGGHVTYHSRSHQNERVEWERVEVDTVIGRMIQHVLPKGVKRIRYYGVQATKPFAKLKGSLQHALSKVQGLVKDAVKSSGFKTYRERYCESAGDDPLVCPHCGHGMGVWKIWHPQYGGVQDELDAIRRGRYASSGRSTSG